MPEIAQATITVTPVLKGAQQKITEDLTTVAGPAGEKAGQAAGQSMSQAIGKKMTTAGAGMTAGLTMPIVAVGTASAKAWKEVDAGLDTIVEKTGASGEALEGMKEVLAGVTTSIPTDFETAGAAIGEVNTRFGLTGDALEELSGQFVKFAKLNDQDVSGSVDSVSKMMAAFGLSVDDAGRMLDALNTVGQQTGVDVGKLSDTLAANAKQFDEMGMSADEAMSFLGSVSMAGMDTSTAMMGLKTAMKNAAKDGLSLSDALEGFDEVMKGNGTESEKLAAAYELFGTKAGAAIENAVSNGTLDLNDFTSSLGDFEGSVSATFEGTLDPMDQFTTTLNDLKLMGADLVETAGPALVEILGGVGDAVHTMTDAWDGLSPDMQDFIIKAAGIAAVVGPLLVIGGKLVGSISTISSGIGGLVGKIGGVGGAASTATAPVAGVAGSFGAFAGQALKLIAAAAALYITAQAVSILADAAIRISNEGGLAVGVLAGMAVGIAALMGVAALAGPALTAGALGIAAFGAAMLGIGEGVNLACTGIAKVTEAVSGLVSTVTSNSEQINSIVSNVGDTVNGTITTVSDGITNIINAISGGVSGVLDSFSGVIDSIGNAALNAGTGFEKLAGAVINLTNNTGVFDLAGTLAAVAGGVDKINSAAAGAGDSAGQISRMTSSMTALSSATNIASSMMQRFGTTGRSAAYTVSSAFASMNLSSSMQRAINGAIWTAQSGIWTLRSMFYGTSFRFNEYIPMPHFSMYGSFDAKTKSVPTVHVSWYEKAAEYGAIFRTPQIIGVGDAAQPEILLGEDKLRKLVGGGAQVTNYITVNGAEDPEAWASKFARRIKIEMRTA